MNQDFTIRLLADEYGTGNGSILTLGRNRLFWRGRYRTFDVREILNPVNGLCHVIYPEDAASGR